MISILFQDAHFVVIDKPANLLVHRSALASERATCLSRLRDQLGSWVYPAHRLDRATSGALLFALSPEDARAIGALFQAKAVEKEYLAIVRGYMPDEGIVDRALADDDGKAAAEALSRFATLARVEWPEAVGKKHESSRYSLLRVWIETGRRHQIRRHLVGQRHPVIGDTTYGDGRHNKFFRERFGIERLLLHARRLRFTHPATGARVEAIAPVPREFTFLTEKFGWHIEV